MAAGDALPTPLARDDGTALAAGNVRRIPLRVGERVG
jgi:hypothetical protein